MSESTEETGRSGRGRRRANQPAGASEPAAGFTPEIEAGTTGRYLVLFREDAVQSGVQALSGLMGVRFANASDYDGGAVDATVLDETSAMVFGDLGVAVVDMPPDQRSQMSAMASAQSGILAIEPERIVYALDMLMPTATTSNDYLLGYRDAVNELVERVVVGASVANGVGTVAAPAFADTASLTWGLQATAVSQSKFTGKGVRVAVLDTGFDLQHPDFVGRQVTAVSFIAGQTVQDGNGHGTHCIGTACGPRQPGTLPRYGIASDAEIYAGKVLSNEGSGSDSGILAGINWAIQNKCAVISMSLGARVGPGGTFSAIFEMVARRALAAGTLIVAAAGNGSSRPGFIEPVSHPANCPSILSVGALDQRLQIAGFSCGGINPQGGQIDIAAPGVGVRSIWPRPMLYRSISGTSMATPHVAGIAALIAEANSSVVGGALGWLLLQGSRRLDLPARDVGVGLAQAPLS